MSDRTCLFCAHSFTGGDRRRKFCWDCLPPHADDPKAYMARYAFLHAACMGGKPEHAQCSIAHLHPKPVPPLKPPKPVMHGPPPPKRCAQCGEATWRPKHCSKLCSRRAAESTDRAKEMKRIRKQRELERLRNDPALRAIHNQRTREWAQRNRDTTVRDPACVDCGCPIPASWKRCAPHRDDYKRQWTAEYRLNSDASRSANARYRARKRGATVEKFRNHEIFKRDKWICQLCTEPIDRSVRAPHPLSVSLDHIVPLSLGGEHSRKNTQCAHLGCNVKKNAKYDDYIQLSLLAVA